VCAESAAPPFILVAGSGSPYELDQVGHPQARARLPRASTRALLNAAHKNAQETQPSRRRSVSVVLSPRSPAGSHVLHTTCLVRARAAPSRAAPRRAAAPA
jgi:hypothetical protein